MPMTVANRYARALAEAAGVQAGEVMKELESFAAIYRESHELRELFDSPAVALHQKSKVLEVILARLQVSAVSANFLRVLLAHYRVGLLEEIRTAFETVVNDRLGVVQMKVFSAAPLSQPEQAALRQQFGALTQKQVDIEYHVNPELLGGVKAQIKSTVYDGSVRGYLDRMGEQMGEG